MGNWLEALGSTLLAGNELAGRARLERIQAEREARAAEMQAMQIKTIQDSLLNSELQRKRLAADDVLSAGPDADLSAADAAIVRAGGRGALLRERQTLPSTQFGVGADGSPVPVDAPAQNTGQAYIGRTADQQAQFDKLERDKIVSGLQIENLTDDNAEQKRVRQLQELYVQATNPADILKLSQALRVRGINVPETFEEKKQLIDYNHRLQLDEIRTQNAGQLAVATARNQGIGDLSEKQLARGLQLTNSLKGHPAYNDMTDIATGYTGVLSGLKQRNGLGDIAAMNAFQRMVDPGATVREGDVALLQKGSALLAKVNMQWPMEKLRTGAVLPDEVRKAMLDTAQELYATRARNYNSSVGNQYKQWADAIQVPFSLIGQDFDALLGQAPAPGPMGPPATPPSPGNKKWSFE